MSIVELLIYIAILSVVVVFALNGMLATGKSVGALKTTRYRDDAVVLGFDRMEREIRAAGRVVTASSTLNTSPGILALDTGTQFYLSGTTLMVKDFFSNNVATATPDDAHFSELVFRQTVSPVSDAVRIEATLDGQNYMTTVTTRGAY